MWTKLSADKKSELMKAYKKGGFSYRDMIDDYNTSYKKFDLGGETDDLTKSGVATLPNNDYNKLTKEQLDILKRQGNLDVVKKWYDENPEDMEGFNQWINTYNSSDLISKYQEKQAKFDEALKNSRDWNNEWYKKRATLPQFKDVATERLNTSNQLSTELSDPINLSIDWWNKTGKPPEVFYAPEIGGITRNNKAKININNIRRGNTDIEKKDSEPFFENAYFTDAKGKLQNSLITHEENHERDFIAPQIGTKQHVNKFKWGEGNNLDPIEKIITKEEQLNDDRNIGYSNSYQQQPTEVRSRLQVWRQINNIDPLKKYSNEEIDKIIKSNLNNPNINSDIKELLETLKNDPEKLNYLNNTYVSINNNNQLPIAKMGGIQKFQPGGATLPKSDATHYYPKSKLDYENRVTKFNDSLLRHDNAILNKLKSNKDQGDDIYTNIGNVKYENAPVDTYSQRRPTFYEKDDEDFYATSKNEVFGKDEMKPESFDITSIYDRRDKKSSVAYSAMYAMPTQEIFPYIKPNPAVKPTTATQVTKKAAVKPVVKPVVKPAVIKSGNTKYQTSGGGKKYYNVNGSWVSQKDYNNSKSTEINRTTGLPINMYGGIQKYQEGGWEQAISKFLGDPMSKAAKAADYKRPAVDPRTRRQHEAEPVDNVRHAAAGRYTQEAIENYANLIPYASAIPGFSKAAGFIGSNILGLGHEASTLFNNDDDTRPWGLKLKESAADAYNNMIGSVIGASNLTPYQKKAYMRYLSETGKMPTGQYNKKKDPTYKKEMGGIQRFDEGGVKKYNSEEEYKAHLLDKWSKEKSQAQVDWLSRNNKQFKNEVKESQNYNTNDFLYSQKELDKYSGVYKEKTNYAQNKINKDGTEECYGCLEQSNRFFNKYVAPKSNVPNTTSLNEAYKIPSGPNNPNFSKYGNSADSWDLAALYKDNGARIAYQAPLNQSYKIFMDLSGKDSSQIDEYYKGLNLPLGTLVNYGDAGLDHEKGLSYNQSKGMVPSNHSTRVVGYDKSGVPYIYDFGEIRRITDPKFSSMAMTNVSVPKEYEKNTFNELSKRGELENKYTKINKVETSGANYDEDEYIPFVNSLINNKEKYANAFGLNDVQYDEYVKRAAAMALTESGGGDDTSIRWKFGVPIPSYITDKIGFGDTKGITQINTENIFKDKKMSDILKSINITKDTYDAWNPEHASAITMALLKLNQKVQDYNAKIPGNKKDLTDAEKTYYQWNMPGVLFKGNAKGDSEKVKKYVENYNKILLK